MRIALWYGISILLHAAVLAAMAAIPCHNGFRPAQYGLVRGGGGGGLGGKPGQAAPTLQSTFSSSPRKRSERLLKMRLEPVAPASGRAASLATKMSPRVQWQRPVASKLAVPPPIVSPPELARVKVSEVGLPAVADTTQRPPRTMLQLASVDVAASDSPQGESARDGDGQTSDGSVAGGARYAVASGKIGSGAVSRPGDGRPRGPGGTPDQLPSALIQNPAPPYPPEALGQGIEGLVLLRVWIREDGTVQGVKIHQSSGNGALDDSALQTVRDRWQFVPASSQGVSVSCQALLPIRFRLRAG